MAMRKALTLCAVMATASAFATLRLAGPYEFIVSRVENCSEPDSNDVSFQVAKTKKSSRWTVLDGHIIIKKDLDENVSANITLYIKTTAGYSKIFNHVFADVCRDLKQKLALSYKEIFTLLGFDPDECPIKAGDYKVESNMTIPPMPEFPALPYGEYNGFVVLDSRDPPSRLGCINGYATIIERPLF